MGVIGAAASSKHATMPASVAQTVFRIFSLFLSPTNQDAQLRLRLFS